MLTLFSIHSQGISEIRFNYIASDFSLLMAIRCNISRSSPARFEMKNGYLLSVVIVLSLFTLPNAQGHFCHRTRSAGEGRTRLTFLREVTVGVSSLYLSVWSEDMQLIRCATNDDPVVTGDYLSFCHKTAIRGKAIRRFNISLLLNPDSPCALNSAGRLKFAEQTKRDVSDLSHQMSEVKSRKKRSWTFPGTLWCGTGSKAMGYYQLGMFENADRCCREHDHCVNIIPAFTVNYGVFNPNIFTVSHCDCDQRFRECLLGVNDSISNLVGYSFFNIFKVPCFKLVQQRQCTEKYWWGMCKVVKEAPYAVFQSPLAYKTTHLVSRAGHTRDSLKSTSTEGSRVKERLLTSPNRKASKSKKPKSCVPSYRCTSRGPPREDSFPGKRRMGKGYNRSKKTSTTTATQTPTRSMMHTAIPSTLTTASQTQKTTSVKVELRTTMITASKINTTTSNMNKLGKKKGSRMKLTTYPAQKSQVPPQATTTPRRKTTPTTQSTPPITQSTGTNMHITQSTPPITQSAGPNAHTIITMTTTTTTQSHKKGQKKRHRCGPRAPVRGDTFQPRRKLCLEKETTSLTPATISPTIKTVLPTQVKTARIQWSNKATASPTEKTLASLWNIAPTMMHTKMKFRTETRTQTTAHLAADGKSPKQRNNSVPLDKTNLEHMTTDNQLLCGALKYLDECKHKIPPLRKKYDLQNMESKTVYHCNCTTRLAGQIEHLRKPNILSSLLMDFVSHYCFKLLNEKDCHGRKSCAAGFSKASDLLQALKNVEGKDRAGVQNLGKDKKRGFSVCLYKRCLRIAEASKRS